MGSPLCRRTRRDAEGGGEEVEYEQRQTVGWDKRHRSPTRICEVLWWDCAVACPTLQAYAAAPGGATKPEEKK